MSEVCLGASAQFHRLMKSTSILFAVGFVGLLLSGCQSTSIPAVALAPTDWTVVDPPQPSPRVTYNDSATGNSVTKAWTQLSNADILANLPDTISQISVGQFNADGTLTYLAAKATASVGTYQVIMDYCQYLPETVTDSSTQQTIGQGRVGVGLRLVANVTTTKANINLGSLMALGVAADESQLSGTMTVQDIGIGIAGSGGPILTNSTIDETGIQKTLESIAVIQSKMGTRRPS
jgi:hypothetical protein